MEMYTRENNRKKRANTRPVGFQVKVFDYTCIYRRDIQVSKRFQSDSDCSRGDFVREVIFVRNFIDTDP